jgi:hypothetical protein
MKEGLTEFKLARAEIMDKGRVLKKQAKASQRNPRIFLLAISPSLLVTFSQILQYPTIEVSQSL